MVFRRGNIPWNKYKTGYRIHSASWKKILSENFKLNNPAKNLRVKQIISNTHKNRPKTNIHKEKISKSLKGRISKNKGKKLNLTKEQRDKISIRSKLRIGNKSANWQGGKSFEKYTEHFNNELKREIRNRDNRKCQICECHKPLDVHHIDYNKKNYNDNNLISLCRSCHMKTNYDREKWTWQLQIFMNLFNEGNHIIKW